MYLDIAARALLAAVFLAATVGKWRDFATFRRSVIEFGVPWPGWVAGIVSVGEAAVVPLVVVPGTVMIGYALAFALLFAFIAGITRVLHNERAVSCRCFGSGGEQLRRHHVARNAVLASVCVAGAVGHLTSSGGPGVGPVVVLAAAGGLLLAVIVIRWDDLAFVLGARPASLPRSPMRG